jgi:DNA-binding NtrC family response regulator
MPGGMTGIDLMSTLRRGDPTLRVVLMSGYYADDALKEVPPGTIFVSKPLSMSDVTRSVRQCLDAPGGTRQNAELRTKNEKGRSFDF